MAWARVDDGWWCHPKVLRLDLAARGLWISVLSWSCQHQTDHVPAAIVTMCGADERIAADLVTAGLWEGPDTSGSYRIHDWDDYQSERAKKADAGRQGGRKSGETRRRDKPSEAKPRASREARPSASHEKTAKLARPGPTQPNPTPTVETTEGPVAVAGGPGGDPSPAGDGDTYPATTDDTASHRKRARQLPDDWQPNERHWQIAAECGRDVQREAEQFRDHALSKHRTLVDWDAGFRNWLRSDYARQPRASPGRGRDPGYSDRDLEQMQAALRAQGQ